MLHDVRVRSLIGDKHYYYDYIGEIISVCVREEGFFYGLLGLYHSDKISGRANFLFWIYSIAPIQFKYGLMHRDLLGYFFKIIYVYFHLIFIGLSLSDVTGRLEHLREDGFEYSSVSFESSGYFSIFPSYIGSKRNAYHGIDPMYADEIHYEGDVNYYSVETPSVWVIPVCKLLSIACEPHTSLSSPFVHGFVLKWSVSELETYFSFEGIEHLLSMGGPVVLSLYCWNNVIPSSIRLCTSSSTFIHGSLSKMYVVMLEIYGLLDGVVYETVSGKCILHHHDDVDLMLSSLVMPVCVSKTNRSLLEYVYLDQFMTHMYVLCSDLLSSICALADKYSSARGLEFTGYYDLWSDLRNYLFNSYPDMPTSFKLRPYPIGVAYTSSLCQHGYDAVVSDRQFKILLGKVVTACQTVSSAFLSLDTFLDVNQSFCFEFMHDYELSSARDGLTLQSLLERVEYFRTGKYYMTYSQADYITEGVFVRFIFSAPVYFVLRLISLFGIFALSLYFFHVYNMLLQVDLVLELCGRNNIPCGQALGIPESHVMTPLQYYKLHRDDSGWMGSVCSYLYDARLYKVASLFNDMRPSNTVIPLRSGYEDMPVGFHLDDVSVSMFGICFAKSKILKIMPKDLEAERLKASSVVVKKKEIVPVFESASIKKKEIVHVPLSKPKVEDSSSKASSVSVKKKEIVPVSLFKSKVKDSSSKASISAIVKNGFSGRRSYSTSGISFKKANIIKIIPNNLYESASIKKKEIVPVFVSKPKVEDSISTSFDTFLTERLLCLICYHFFNRYRYSTGGHIVDRVSHCLLGKVSPYINSLRSVKSGNLIVLSSTSHDHGSIVIDRLPLKLRLIVASYYKYVYRGNTLSIFNKNKEYCGVVYVTMVQFKLRFNCNAEYANDNRILYLPSGSIRNHIKDIRDSSLEYFPKYNGGKKIKEKAHT